MERIKPELGENARISVLITIASRGAIIGLKTLNAIILARTLGKEGLGLFALLQAVPGILALLTTLGVPGSSPYLIENRKFHPQQVLSNAVLVAVGAGSVGAFLWLATSASLSTYLFEGLSIQWLRLAALLIPLQIIWMVMVFFLRGLQHFGYANLLRILPEAGVTASVAVMLALGYLNASKLVPCILAGYTLAVCAGAVRSISLGFRPVPAYHKRLLRESISFGIREQVTTAIHFLNLRLDHMILAVMTNTSTVGIYFVATKASELFKVVPSAVGFVLGPKIAGRTPRAAARTVKRLCGTRVSCEPGNDDHCIDRGAADHPNLFR